MSYECRQFTPIAEVTGGTTSERYSRVNSKSITPGTTRSGIEIFTSPFAVDGPVYSHGCEKSGSGFSLSGSYCQYALVPP